jgi:hypothetical protein
LAFLFEFMDQAWIPGSLHATLREVLEFHLRVTLFYYYRWAADEALKKARRIGAQRVLEMGAGSAGFSQTLASRIRDEHDHIQVEISDLRPNVEQYRILEQSFRGILHARTEPLDFLTTASGSEKNVTVLSAAFHHVPFGARQQILQSMATREVMIFESVTRNARSILGCAIGFLPAVLTPLFFFGNRSGRWRRFFWCWLIPAAPLMVAWDGVVSCLRCWTEEEWRSELKKVGVSEGAISTERRAFSHMISWSPRT